MRKTLLTLGALSIVAVITIGLLYRLSQARLSMAGGFTRAFRPHSTGKWTEYISGSDNSYFAGSDSSGVYIAQHGNPSLLQHFGPSLTDKQDFNLSFDSLRPLETKTGAIQVAGQRMYWLDGFRRQLLVNHIDSTRAIQVLPDSLYFNLCLPLDNSHFIFRIKDPKLLQHVLVAWNGQYPNAYQHRLVLQKQIDGIFCTDGQLLRKGKSDTLIYVFFYRNEWMLLDHHLHLLDDRRTIDTNSTVKISVTQIDPRIRGLSTPDYFSNRLSTADDRFLYIQSGLVSDNERFSDFRENAVIDVYEIASGKYEFSFYVPLLGEKNIREIQVVNHHLFLLSGKSIRCFPLSF